MGTQKAGFEELLKRKKVRRRYKRGEKKCREVLTERGNQGGMNEGRMEKEEERERRKGEVSTPKGWVNCR